MRNYAIVFLFLIQGCFLASPYFVGRASPSEAVFESGYFALAVLVYAVSFFELGRARYLLLPFYAHLIYRCVSALPPSLASGAYPFSLGCLLALIALFGVCWHIVARPGLRLPQGWLMRLFLFLWVVFLALVSRVPVMLVYSVGMKSVPAFYALVLLAAFASTALTRDRREWLVAAQASAVLIFVVPYLRMLPLGPDAIFSPLYVHGSMASIAGTALVGWLLLLRGGERRAA